MQANTLDLDQSRGIKDFIPIYLWAAMILIVAELIGSISIPLGSAKVVLLPMIWALIIGAIIGKMSEKSSSAFSLTRNRQVISSQDRKSVV